MMSTVETVCACCCRKADGKEKSLRMRLLVPVDHRVFAGQPGLGNNMDSRQIAVVASVMAILRGDLTASFVADRFGVTEACVNEWKDVFVSAGVLAVAETLNGFPPSSHAAVQVCDMGGPTTTPYPEWDNYPAASYEYRPTTTPCPDQQ